MKAPFTQGGRKKDSQFQCPGQQHLPAAGARVVVPEDEIVNVVFHHILPPFFFSIPSIYARLSGFMNGKVKLSRTAGSRLDSVAALGYNYPA